MNLQQNSKHKLSFLLLLMVWQIGSGQFYIRYNHLGYVPSASKTIVVLSNQNLDSLDWILTENDRVVAQDTLPSSFTSAGIHTPFAFNYRIDLSYVNQIGNYTLSIGDSSISFRIDTNNYAFLPKEILRYFRVQRSGSKACLDHKISHKGDKKCVIHRRKTDKNDNWGYLDYMPKYANMSGGWYDAGDYIKFTLTTAYSSYLMLLAYEQNPTVFEYKKYTERMPNDLLDEATWGLDYLVKTYKDTNEFILQVGGNKDHQQGNRLPEYDELNRHREAYSGFSPTQMAYTAAALALGAKTFESVDSVRANVYKKQAIAIYKKARMLTDCYWVKQGWEEFYADKTPYDNLLLAATELYLLTQNIDYKEDMYFFGEKAKQGYWTSWGNCNLLAHTRAGIFEYGVKDLNYFDGITKEPSNVWGIGHKYTWSSLYSMYAEANGAMLHQLNSNNASFRHHYYTTLDYSLGANNWGKSFVCSDQISDCACNTYSQIYVLQPKIKPIGAVAEGPGDRATHEQIRKYFQLPENYSLEKFNSNGAVFYDLNTNFQTMETNIVGLAEALLFYALADKISH